MWSSYYCYRACWGEWKSWWSIGWQKHLTASANWWTSVDWVIGCSLDKGASSSTVRLISKCWFSSWKMCVKGALEKASMLKGEKLTNCVAQCRTYFLEGVIVSWKKCNRVMREKKDSNFWKKFTCLLIKKKLSTEQDSAGNRMWYNSCRLSKFRLRWFVYKISYTLFKTSYVKLGQFN